uniref:Uncharacterized protein n=1 Tax=Apteryx owenii TaxID=8824 RepID=A0A8B9PQQ4_APTOW
LSSGKEKHFEANTFAKSLCQHCFRVAGAHQHASQVSSTISPGGYEYFFKGPFVWGWDSMCLCRYGNLQHKGSARLSRCL